MLRKSISILSFLGAILAFALPPGPYANMFVPPATNTWAGCSLQTIRIAICDSHDTAQSQRRSLRMGRPAFNMAI